jgi:hypothetical protein
MARILDATCESGIVTVEGQEITPTFIFSEGVGASIGKLIIDGNRSYYLAKTSPDLKTTIEKVSESIEKIGEILTSIGAGMTGPTTAPPGTLASDVAEINAIASELNELGESLK